MKAKDLSSQLSGLIGSTANGGFGTAPSPGMSPGGMSYEDSIPEELQDPEPIFEMNYKSEQRQAIKKAKDSITIIVKEVVPESLQNSALIKDKINQDAEQLGNLYYQYKKKEVVHQALMETIARGETEAKRFDAFEKMSKSLEELGEKITNMQNQFRKYYIDTYLDMQHKDEEDDYINSGANKAISNDSENPRIMDSSEVEPQNNESNIINGTDEVTKMLAEKKRKALMAKYYAEKNKSESEE